MSAPESPTYTVTQLAAWSGEHARLARIAEERGWQLPARGEAWFGDSRIALAVRPRRWLLLDPSPATADLTKSWDMALGMDGAAVDLSAALVAWRLRGAASRDILAQGCRLDLDPTVFPTGRVASTLIAQVIVSIAALPDGWLLLAPSSTAVHFSEWLDHVAHRA